eukprot:6161109-Amphidinium_carterae.1
MGRALAAPDRHTTAAMPDIQHQHPADAKFKLMRPQQHRDALRIPKAVTHAKQKGHCPLHVSLD